MKNNLDWMEFTRGGTSVDKFGRKKILIPEYEGEVDCYIKLWKLGIDEYSQFSVRYYDHIFLSYHPLVVRKLEDERMIIDMTNRGYFYCNEQYSITEPFDDNFSIHLYIRGLKQVTETGD